MILHQIQREHREWLARMYPDQDKLLPAAGFVEEAGELVHAVLKTRQHDSRHANLDLRAAMVDAIGDCAIYMCSYCNTADWSFSALCDGAVFTVGNDDPLKQATRVVAAGSRFIDSLEWTDALIAVSELKGAAVLLDIDFAEAVAAAWQEVKERRK